MTRLRTSLVIAGCLVVALALQVALFARLGLPGATPDLVLVVVAVVAIARGASAGAITGFAGGLLVDLAPPADHPAGQWALVLTLVGYAAGSLPWQGLELRGASVLAIGGLAAAATLGAVIVGVVVGSGWPGLGRAVQLAATGGLYAGVLAVLALPVLAPLLRWAGPRERAWAAVR